MSERCASHPERDAEITCARCGNFACAECRAGDELCKSCEERLGHHPLIRHVPILGVAMIVHGVLTAGMGIFLAAFGVLYVFNLPAQAPGEATDDLSSVLFFVMILLAIPHLVPGALSVLAGWRLRTFRGRGLAIAALVSGVLTVLGCYCALSSLGISIWGLIVLLHPEVVERFDRANSARPE